MKRQITAAMDNVNFRILHRIWLEIFYWLNVLCAMNSTHTHWYVLKYIYIIVSLYVYKIVSLVGIYNLLATLSVKTWVQRCDIALCPFLID